MRTLAWLALFISLACPALAQQVTIQTFPVPKGAHPHDVAPAKDGKVWYTAQNQGALGLLDPATGKAEQIQLGKGSAPHGVIVGPDNLAWVTDGGLNAIVSVDAKTHAVRRYPLPANGEDANLNTAVFDHQGILWFTGQNGIYGRLDPSTGSMTVFSAPKGVGPYGIAVTPGGEVWYVSLAGDYVAHIDRASGRATVVEPPRPDSGPRRIWSDSKGVLWISEWNGGRLASFDPNGARWREWPLPGANPMAYAVYVDETDKVWLSDFGANAVLRFDPQTEQFEAFPSAKKDAAIRQMLGRPGEVWAAESGTDSLTVYRHR